MFDLPSSMLSQCTAWLKDRKAFQLGGDFIPGLTNMQGYAHDVWINSWLHQ